MGTLSTLRCILHDRQTEAGVGDDTGDLLLSLQLLLFIDIEQRI